MRLPMQLFTLPAGLLLLIAMPPTPVSARELQWHYNIPPHVKYYPEDEALVRRDIEIRQRLQHQPAVGVRKMSDDPGEMFFLDYWSFPPLNNEPESDTANCNKVAEQNSQIRPPPANDSLLVSFAQPFRLHSSQKISESSIVPWRLRFSLFERANLDSRGFLCPNETTPCTALDPDVCCGIGETCVTVPDANNGLGTVGCCPYGETCAGSLTACPSGYNSCPNNPGGGCCIPGYACYDVGCVQTATIYVVPTVALPSSTSTTVAVPPVTSTPSSIATSISPSYISTSTTTISKITSSTSTTTHISCPPSFQSCAVSLGGGCCSNNMVCGPGKTCLPQSSTVSVEAPYRPTSVVTTTTSTTHSSIPGAGCPTGYYACSAYYPGGCCQIDRDCNSTSCPAIASTTLLNSNSLTIIAPTGSGISLDPAQSTGTCASGWFSCPATSGGGCCPSGHGCGPTCTPTASTNNALKVQARKEIWLACVGTLAMVLHAAFR